ncbi:FAD-binding protein [Lactiplantibacillus plantarum]|uniref:FAD-dependent oxidoreductase n=1 Tax=Lactiplantibacillus plantarum TaxID=1590 RepID=UPI001B321F81|nr:FAD-binding protein [Lactiplantibacillus plantarum]MBP5818492.1 FAD-binding protein [Lactiplantibacillus plantarum]
MNNEYDVIIVGASNAGGLAAAGALQKGAKVLVIDKMKSAGYLYRDTIAAIGSKAQKKAGVKIDKMKLLTFLSAFAQDNIDQNLLRTWMDHSAEPVDWIDDNVLKPKGAYMQATPDAAYKTLINTAFPTGNEVTKKDGSYWEMEYGNWIIEKLQELGAEFRWQTKLEHLIVEDGKVIGVEVKDEDKKTNYKIKAKKGVILATGGYGSNLALMQKWNPLGLKINAWSDSQRDDGSGIVAAMEIGAAKDEQPASIVFNRAAVPVGTNMKNYYNIDMTPPDDPYYLWLGSYGFLKVNLNGKRFFNESSPYQFDMNSASKQPNYIEVTIWDKDTMSDENLKRCHTLGCSRLGFPGIYTADEAREEVETDVKLGVVKKADSIEDLAKQLDLPVDELKKTISRYNELAHQGKDEDFGKDDNRLFPIENGPFYGAWLGGRLLATLDGLRINTHMQVLNEMGKVIPGLFAAGNCSGGFFWGSYPDRVPGLTASHAQTFGMLAGRYAAEN